MGIEKRLIVECNVYCYVWLLPTRECQLIIGLYLPGMVVRRERDEILCKHKIIYTIINQSTAAALLPLHISGRVEATQYSYNGYMNEDTL
jgi:hypothetical protein